MAPIVAAFSGENQQSMYLGVWQFNARKPALLLGDGEKCASKVSKSGVSNGHEVEIATDGGRFIALSTNEIDELCEGLNIDGDSVSSINVGLPAVVIGINSGQFCLARSTQPVRIIVLDKDTEDANHVQQINGSAVCVDDVVLTEKAIGVTDGVAPAFQTASEDQKAEWKQQWTGTTVARKKLSAR